MIHQSAYWKEELSRSERYLVGRLESTAWTDRSLGKLEKTIMVGLYAIRKLSEAGKIPKSFLKKQVNVQMHRVRSKPLGDISDLAKNYDLNNPEKAVMPISLLLNQIIHSYVYVPVMDRNDRIEGFLFNSDRTKDFQLYLINIKDVIKLIGAVSTGSIVSLRYRLADGKMELIETTYKNDWEKV